LYPVILIPIVSRNCTLSTTILLYYTMKYLDYPLLTELSNTLSNSNGPDVKLNVRIEAYSVKPIGKEKKMFKNMEEAYVSEQEELAE